MFAMTMADASFTPESNSSKQSVSNSSASELTIDLAKADECLATYFMTKHAAFL